MAMLRRASAVIAWAFGQRKGRRLRRRAPLVPFAAPFCKGAALLHVRKARQGVACVQCKNRSCRKILCFCGICFHDASEGRSESAGGALLLPQCSAYKGVSGVSRRRPPYRAFPPYRTRPGQARGVFLPSGSRLNARCVRTGRPTAPPLSGSCRGAPAQTLATGSRSAHPYRGRG